MKMGIYTYCRERGVTIEVSSRLLQSSTRKGKEMLHCSAALILAFVGIECQPVSIMRLVIILLLAEVANVTLVPQVEHVGKGREFPGEPDCYGPPALYTSPPLCTFPTSTYFMPLNPLPYVPVLYTYCCSPPLILIT